VLGFERWRKLDAQYAIKDLMGGLNLLQQPHLLVSGDVETTAYLLHGAINEAALYLADADDPEATLERLLAGLRLLLRGVIKDRPHYTNCPLKRYEL
jgi:hypothetical protein